MPGSSYQSPITALEGRTDWGKVGKLSAPHVFRLAGFSDPSGTVVGLFGIGIGNRDNDCCGETRRQDNGGTGGAGSAGTLKTPRVRLASIHLQLFCICNFSASASRRCGYM